MMRRVVDTVVLVTRKTSLEENLSLFQTKGQAKFVLKQKALAQTASAKSFARVSKKESQARLRQAAAEAEAAFARMETQNEAYAHAVGRIRSFIPKGLKVQEIDRSQLPQFLWGEHHIPVVVGVDGLVVNTAKYLDGHPLVAVNPQPDEIEGVLLPWEVEDFPEALARARDGHPTAAITMAEAVLDDGQRLLAFNDLFLGRSSHVSARYGIEYDGRFEKQSSSGIIVSTGAGSTGWMRSVVRASAEVQAALGGEPVLPDGEGRFDWGEERLRFVVREPFPSRTTETNLVFGDVDPGRPLFVESEMASGGVIFSDGVENDYLSFPAGSRAEVKISDRRAQLVVP